MLRTLQQQLDGLREELKAQHAEAKRQQETAGREAREMQERFLLELEAQHGSEANATGEAASRRYEGAGRLTQEADERNQ